MSANNRRIEIVGHGGAGAFFPGNSREALLAALELGVDRIEFDLRAAAGNELVLIHDAEMRDLNGTMQKTADIPVSRLRRLLPGLLTLDEAFELLGGRVKILLDIKAPGFESELIAAIRRHGIEEEINLSCTSPQVIRTLRHAFPAMPIGLSTGHRPTSGAVIYGRRAMRTLLRLTTPPFFLTTMHCTGANQIMLNRYLASPRVVRRYQRSGFAVYVWTVDHPAEIRRMIACGVDAIISNRPDLVQEALGRKRAPNQIDPTGAKR